MSNLRMLQRSFAGGEVAPELFGRIDDVKYQTGLATSRNFITKPQGPAENRPGFEYVRAVKDSTKKVRLIPFTYSTTQTMVLEVGAGYFRFHTAGATLLAGSPAAYSAITNYVVGDMCSSGGVNYYCIAATVGNAPPNASYWYALPASGEYEIPNPYAEADLFDLHYVQSADVLTITHPNYPPRELRRYGATNWQLSTVSFAASIAAPTGQSATPNATDTTYTYSYVVTAIAADGFSESPASAVATCQNNLFTTGRWNTIAWSAVTGASRYNVYKLQGGLYGYIGQTTGLSIVDDNIAPDLGKTPPIYESVFAAAGDYPAAVSYFEQRRCFAGTVNKPQNIWMTRSGIRRSVNGTSVRYVERLHSRQFTAQADAFFVDCGLTYQGAPATVITGLSHLEGKTVSILADGAVHPQRTVTAGQITLDAAASTVHVGLPITADLQTLPIAAQVDGGFAQGRVKNVNKVWLRVYRSSGIFVGPQFSNLTESKQRTTEPPGTPPALKTDEIEITIMPSWQNGAQVCVRQADPLPLTVINMTAEVALGA